MAAHFHHVEHDAKPADAPLAILVEVGALEFDACAGRRKPWRIERPAMRTASLPVEGGFRLPRHDVRSINHLEPEVGERPPRVVEEGAHIVVADDYARPR